MTLENIPYKNRFQYFFISLPGSIKYVFNLLKRILKGQELPRNLKDGDVIITKDGEFLIFDSCDCPQDS